MHRKNNSPEGQQGANKQQTSCIGAHNLAKSISNRVDQIVGHMMKNDIHVDRMVECILKDSLDMMTIRAFGLETFFMPFLLDEQNDNRQIDIVSILIYSKEQIIFANPTFVRAAGLTSMSEVIQLSKEGTLLENILEGASLETAKNRIATHGQTGRYINEHLEMKRTKKKIIWNTVSNPQDSGNSIRISIGFEKCGGLENYLECTRTQGLETRLGFYDIVKNKYPKHMEALFEPKSDAMLDEIVLTTIDPNSKEGRFKAAIDASKEGITLQKDLDRLTMLSVIGDIIMNYGPIPVFFQRTGDIFANQRYLNIIGYTYEELSNMLLHEGFGDTVLGQDANDDIQEKLRTLNIGERLSKIVAMNRKDGMTVDVLWNIHKIDTKDTFWSGIVIGAPKKKIIKKYQHPEDHTSQLGSCSIVD